MKFNKIQYITSYGFKGREYVFRNTKDDIDEIEEHDYSVVYEDEPEWNGSGVLMVILDGGEPMTLEMLKQKKVELEENERWKLLRELRDKLLSETDYLMNTDYPHKTEEVKQHWKDYRQALRDLPENSNPMLNENGDLDMNSFVLPSPPNETAE